MLPINPHRIAFLKPCCIGDVVFATPLLEVIRRAYPTAPLDWYVSDWSADVLRGHPAIKRLIATGPGANPAQTPGGLLQLAWLLRKGRYDLLIVPDRSPRYSLAAVLSGIRWRVGLDSAGRGFGYTIRARIDPNERRHEAQIYLDLARALGLPTADQWAALYPTATASATARAILQAAGLSPDAPLVLAHPGGGINPGMALVSKRWPLDRLTALLDLVAPLTNATVIALGSSDDRDLTRSVVQSVTNAPVIDLAGKLSLSEIAALAALPQVRLYVGNDTGATHIAAAVGAPVLALFGPSDPTRYAPFASPDHAAYAWRPVPIAARGVADQATKPSPAFDWVRDGVSTDEAFDQAMTLLNTRQR